MSNKGAIKKTTEAEKQVNSEITQKEKPCASYQNISELNGKIKTNDKQKDLKILDLKTIKDTKYKTKSVSNDKLISFDINSLKSKVSKQNDLQKSSYNELSNTLSIAKRSITYKKKIENSINPSITKAAKNHARNNIKEKDDGQYNDKKRTNSIKVSKGVANKLSNISKPLKSKKIKEKTTASENVEESLLRNSLKEVKRSTMSNHSDFKIAQKVYNKIQSENPEKDNINEEIDIESNPDSTCNYFEDYESDFEECYSTSQISEVSDNSICSIELEPIELHIKKKKTKIDNVEIDKVEEEDMLDFKNYEIQEVKKRVALVEILMANHLESSPSVSKMKQTLNHSSRVEKQFENKSLPSSTDEGFEESRSGDFIKSPVLHISHENLQDCKQEIIKKPLTKTLNRGDILMNMIKFDTVEWSLYESKPISYEEFIQNYGKLNTQQIFTQTHEDNLDIEIQTDKNEFKNKWTQFPVKCRNKLETIEDIKLFKMEHYGVGGDKSNSTSLNNTSYDILKLNEFLNKAGKLMLALLEEREMGGNILQNETHEFPFSDGFIKLSVSSISFLCGRQVTMLHYSEINNKILISIHTAINEKIDSPNKEEYIMNCCIGCVWNVNEPSRPEKLFYSQSPITACCFHSTNNNIIFAGHKDGSISLWDLREEEIHHKKIIDKINELFWILRSPTYTTAGNREIDSHLSPIVSIRILSKIEEDEIESLNDKFISIQICSLDEEGHLIIWSVLRNLNLKSNDNGLAQWGRVKLIKSQKMTLFKKKNISNNTRKEFVDMNIDNVDSNHFYLANSDMNILYANCLDGIKNIPYYKINESDCCVTTTCIEVCPFKQPYFLTGYMDGSIRLHSLNIGSSIIKLKEANCSAEIKGIQWSKSKLSIIYVLDNHSRIIVWDLSKSDIDPIHIVSTKSWGYVKCIKLSSCHSNDDMLSQNLALGTDTGNIEVHKLKKNFYSTQQDDIFQEMENFLKYTSIL